MLKDTSTDEKTTLMKYLLDLVIWNPLPQDELLDGIWQVYMIIEKVKK